jgi:hypothetical protein
MAIKLSSTCLIVALSLWGCGSTTYERTSLSADQSAEPTQEPEPCGRLESAAYGSTLFFRATADIAESCANDPHLVNCNPANFVIGSIAGVAFAPMGFVIGLLANPGCKATAPVIVPAPIEDRVEAPEGGEVLGP